MHDEFACAALLEEARTGDWIFCRAVVGACQGQTAPGVLGVLDVEVLIKCSLIYIPHTPLQ